MPHLAASVRPIELQVGVQAVLHGDGTRDIEGKMDFGFVVQLNGNAAVLHQAVQAVRPTNLQGASPCQSLVNFESDGYDSRPG